MQFTRFLVPILALMLTGCKTELYTNLSEREGNTMLAILLAEGIAVDKIIDKNGLTLTVDNSQVVHALEALKRQGYPKEQFATVKELFPDEGLISSPTQERARYLFAKSQEIAATLAQIDGVITARVHIASPEIKKNNSNKPQPQLASASVFIKHSPDMPLESYSAQIKTLVNNSVESLQYDKISVVMFPANDINAANKAPQLSDVLSVKVATQSKTRLWVMLATLFFLLIGTNLYWLQKRGSLSPGRIG